MIFVFGSNLAGFHGSGAAAFAKAKHGAVQGQGVGRQGNSYAIPTKDEGIQTLPLAVIASHVTDFIIYAGQHPEEGFHVTRIGCGLAGYHDDQIAPMFTNAPDNCFLPAGWRQMNCRHTRQVTPEGQYTIFACLDCHYVGVVV